MFSLLKCLNLCEARIFNSQDLINITPPLTSDTASYDEGIGVILQALHRPQGPPCFVVGSKMDMEEIESEDERMLGCPRTCGLPNASSAASCSTLLRLKQKIQEKVCMFVFLCTRSPNVESVFDAKKKLFS